MMGLCKGAWYVPVLMSVGVLMKTVEEVVDIVQRLDHDGPAEQKVVFCADVHAC